MEKKKYIRKYQLKKKKMTCWYRTPTTLHTIYPSFPLKTCRRCSLSPADMLPIFCCSNLFDTDSYNSPNKQAFFVPYHNIVPIKAYKNAVVSHQMNLVCSACIRMGWDTLMHGITCIPEMCKSYTLPKVHQWFFHV